jgi:hypothetical protein
LGAWYWFSHAKIFSTILLGASFLVHPYIGLGALAFIVIQSRPSIRDLLTAGAGSALINLPVLFYQAIPFLQTPHAFVPRGFVFSLSQFTSIPSLLGVVPFILVIVLLLWNTYSRKKMFHDVELEKMGIVTLAFILFFVIFQFFPIATFAPKILQWGSIALILFGALLLPHHFSKRNTAILVLLILVTGFGVLLTSASIQRFVHGSKSTLEEAQFAHAIRELDSSLAPTLFLSNGSGKMAQYSHKIPMDAMSANFTLVLFLMGGDVAQKYKDQSAAIREMIKRKCTECVENYYPAYTAVNTDVFPALQGKEPVLTNGNFILYRNELFFDTRTN